MTPIVRFPKDLDELKKTVCYAKECDLKICLVGAGLSQNEQNKGSTGFMTIKLDRMNEVKVDAGREVAIVTGNVLFRDMEAEANLYGLTTKVRQGSGIFGILSSIATNVHGWDHKTGCIGNTVNWIRALDGDSNEYFIQPEDAKFKECVGSFGGSYLMFQVEIQLTKNVVMRKESVAFDTVTEALAGFHARRHEADLGLIWVGKTLCYTVLFTPISSTGWVSQDLILEGPHGPYFDRLLVDITRAVTLFGWKRLFDWAYENCVEKAWTRTEIKLRNELMNVNVNALFKIGRGVIFTHEFWLVEYFVQEKHLEELVEMYRFEFEDVAVYNATLRYVPQYTETYAPYARTDIFALVLCWDQILNEEEIAKSVERNKRFLEFLRQRSGTFYMAYKNDPGDMAEFYLEFTQWVQQRDGNIFSNDMIEKLRDKTPRSRCSIM